MPIIRGLCAFVLLATAAQAAAQVRAPTGDQPKPATIGGRITDAATGRPIRMARVRIALDSRTERLEFTARTADDGRYSVDDVPAGRYVVTVSKSRYVQLQHGQRLPAAAGRPVDVAAGATQQVDVALPRASAVTGRVVDEFGEPIERATGVNVTVTPTRTATISGQVVRPDGSPVPKWRVWLADHAGSGPGGNLTGGAMVDEQGRFSIAGVRAGEYYLMGGAGQERGVLPIEVSGADVSGLTLLVGTGGLLSARVVSSTGEPLPIAPARVELSARLLADPYLFSGVERPSIKPDWTVDWIGVTGPRLIRATRLPAGWWMKAIVRGDRDITDDVIELTHGQIVKDLTVVLDNRPTEIAGVARDSKGAVASDYTVIAFSPNARTGRRKRGSSARPVPAIPGASTSPRFRPGTICWPQWTTSNRVSGSSRSIWSRCDHVRARSHSRRDRRSRSN